MSRTLLLADDSVVIQKLVGLSFANEDIEIIIVDNGDDAVTQAQSCKPDVVLADVVMPGLNGYQVCEAIRKDSTLRDIPVLLLTGTFEAFDEKRAQEAGATGHITKPFEAQALVDRVNQLLQESSVKPGTNAAEASGDFFEENPGDLAADTTLPPGPEVLEDFAFGDAAGSASGAATTIPGATLPGANSETVALDIGLPGETGTSPFATPGLDSLLDDAGGDRTVALMPEPDDSDILALATTIDDLAGGDDVLVQGSHDDLAETMLVGDLPEANPGSPEVAAPLEATDSGDPPAAAIGSVDLTEFGSPAAVPAAIAEPAAEVLEEPASSLDFEELSFDSASTTPPSNLDPIGDETVLAGDLFSDGPDASAGSYSLTSPDSSLPPSKGLDLDFVDSDAVSAASVVPENVNDFDVSSSDLKIDSSNWNADLPEAPAPAVDTTLDSIGPAAGFEAMPVAPIIDEPSDAPKAVSGETCETEAGISTGPDLTPMMRQQVHDTLEKIAWEAFSDISEDIVRQVLERVEKIAWEVIPQMAETLVREEIRRMKGEDD